jgi:hypothetical protein
MIGPSQSVLLVDSIFFCGFLVTTIIKKAIVKSLGTLRAFL